MTKEEKFQKLGEAAYKLYYNSDYRICRFCNNDGPFNINFSHTDDCLFLELFRDEFIMNDILK